MRSTTAPDMGLIKSKDACGALPMPAFLAMPHRTRVLVVHDNQDTDDSLLGLLESHGYNAKGVYGARTIVADVRDFDPDVIIVDIAMPNRNGWNAARQVRQHRPGKRPVLIAVSGQCIKGGDKIFAETSAYDYYVIKPCAPRALLELVALHAQDERGLARFS